IISKIYKIIPTLLEGFAAIAMIRAPSLFGSNNVNVLGSKKNAIEKITGITQAENTFKGS
ncbi:hypothetical protein EV43_15280, partial [Staphylococcus aureus]